MPSKVALEIQTNRLTEIYKRALMGGASPMSLTRELGNALTAIINNVAKSAPNGKYTIDVKLIKSPNEFVGMCVYPDINTLTAALSDLTFVSISKAVSAWESIDKYTLEIDENVFDRNLIAFSPEELTAMSLHELGHVIFSSYVPERLYRAYRTHAESLDMMDKKILRKVLGIFYVVPTLTICGIHKWYIGKNGMYEEYYCDKVFGIPDAQENMASALNKIIKRYGNSIIIKETEDIKLHEADRDMNWCNLNIIDISRRREYLQAELFNRSARTKSITVKRAFLNISAKLGVGLKDRYTHAVIAMESVVGMVDSGELPIEGVFDAYEFTHGFNGSSIENIVAMSLERGSKQATEALKSNKAPILPSDYALDEISIEVDKIENHNDRIYVLDLIYSRIEDLTAFEKWAKANDQYQRYSSKIQQKRDYLNTLRQAVLTKKLPDKNYGVYVQYPKGYEG